MAEALVGFSFEYADGAGRHWHFELRAPQDFRAGDNDWHGIFQIG